MAKYKQLFLVVDTFLPWETVGGRAGNREIEACQLNSWHKTEWKFAAIVWNRIVAGIR